MSGWEVVGLVLVCCVIAFMLGWLAGVTSNIRD